ncbi:hypothetical protein D3C77_617350 [compost metagenome]
MLNGMFATSRFRLVFVGTAEVVHCAFYLTAAHSLATIGATENATEQIELLFLRSGASVTL